MEIKLLATAAHKVSYDIPEEELEQIRSEYVSLSERYYPTIDRMIYALLNLIDAGRK